MISYEAACDIIKQKTLEYRLSSEWTTLESVAGRIVAKDIYSHNASPPFDNSAMDGFAIASSATLNATEKNPTHFSIVGSIAAGDPSFQKSIEHSHLPAAVEIMTGAPLPRYLPVNAVIKVEDAEKIGLDKIVIKKTISPGENIRSAGDDIQRKERLISKGTWIGPEHIMAMASVGISSIPVFKKPVIAILSTGKELAHHTKVNLSNSHIYNSTAPYLLSAISLLGGSPRFYGSIVDDPDQFIEIFQQISQEKPDLIISTGAVSVGKYDFIKEALTKLGAEIFFHKVAIRPGKPMLFAQIPHKKTAKNILFFGFPGNPVPAVTGLRFFVEPYLRILHGLPAEKPILARTINAAQKPHSLRCFFKAILTFHKNEALVHLLPGQESFKVKPLLQANAWAVLFEEKQWISEGELIEVFPFYPSRK